MTRESFEDFDPGNPLKKNIKGEDKINNDKHKTDKPTIEHLLPTPPPFCIFLGGGGGGGQKGGGGGQNQVIESLEGHISV